MYTISQNIFVKPRAPLVLIDHSFKNRAPFQNILSSSIILEVSPVAARLGCFTSSANAVYPNPSLLAVILRRSSVLRVSLLNENTFRQVIKPANSAQLLQLVAFQLTDCGTENDSSHQTADTIFLYSHGLLSNT